MKKLVLFVLLITANLGFTQQNKHTFGLVVDYWEYTEPRIKDSGFLYGVHYRYQTDLTSAFDWIFGTEFILGQTEYDGETLNTGTPVVADQNNKIFELYSLFQLNLTKPFNPLVGLYFRYLQDEDDETAGDYRRKQQYITIPIGFSYEFTESRLVFLYHTSFQGENQTFLTDVGGNRDLTMDQEEGSGFSIEWEYFISTNGSISIFYRTWDVEDSESKQATVPSVNGGVPSLFEEPENETQSIGMRFSTLF